MATLDPTVFNRLRDTIDELTDVAHIFVRQLDGEIATATGAAQGTLQYFRDQIAAIGLSLDLSDPECDQDTGRMAGVWGSLEDIKH
jgi:hypothetical protein